MPTGEEKKKKKQQQEKPPVVLVLFFIFVFSVNRCIPLTKIISGVNHTQPCFSVKRYNNPVVKSKKLKSKGLLCCRVTVSKQSKTVPAEQIFYRGHLRGSWCGEKTPARLESN